MHSDFQLTSLSPAGGCGCKVPTTTLAELVGPDFSPGVRPEALLAAGEHREDAAVWRHDDGGLLVATNDFFTPLVDDARDFGRIAAANALSDIYAMGARPLFALNILAAPLDKTPPGVLTQIMEGGSSMCAEAQTPVAGGHSINVPSLIYGLAVVGCATPERLRRNHTARDGDALVLTKPLGTGILARALRDCDDDEAYAEMLHWTTRLNDVGMRLATLDAVHALTDVSGFGLLGHLDEMCKGARLAADLRADDVPLMHALARFADKTPGAGAQNNLRGLSLDGAEKIAAERLHALADPQTSGGLLVACEPSSMDAVVGEARATGFDRAACIGRFREGEGIRLL